MPFLLLTLASGAAAVFGFHKVTQDTQNLTNSVLIPVAVLGAAASMIYVIVRAK